MDHTTSASFQTPRAGLEGPTVRTGATSVLDWAPARTPSRSAWERAQAERRFRDLTTRALSVLLAVVLLVLTLPLMAVIALAVKLTSPGPVFFSQERVGLDKRLGSRRHGPRRFRNDRRKQDRGGRIFWIHKFRTMYVSGSDAPQVWASKNDSRVTPVGRFLRAHRLDELPQLFNVLKGDMNLVGPRPEQPEIFDELCDTFRHFPQRQSVRPGITGWAQVNNGYDESLEDVRKKLRYDLEYVDRQSVLEDLKIILRTPRVMLLREGAR